MTRAQLPSHPSRPATTRLLRGPRRETVVRPRAGVSVMMRRTIGCLALSSLLAVSLACGTSGGGVEEPAVEQYLRGPFLTAAGETGLPPVANPFPAATPIMHFAWSHPNLPANERITFALVAL